MGDEGAKVEPKYMWKILDGVEWKPPPPGIVITDVFNCIEICNFFLFLSPQG